MHETGDTRQGAKEQLCTVQGSTLTPCQGKSQAFSAFVGKAYGLREKPLPGLCPTALVQKTHRPLDKHATTLGCLHHQHHHSNSENDSYWCLCFGNTLVPRITVHVSTGGFLLFILLSKNQRGYQH